MTTRLIILVLAVLWLGACSPVGAVSMPVLDGGAEGDRDADAVPQAGSGGSAGEDSASTAGTGGTGGAGAGGMLEAPAGTGGGMAGMGGKAAPGKCEAGKRQCDGRVPQDCVDGQWVSGSQCPFVCKDGACGGTCTPGAKQCRSNVPETCEDGEWKARPACPNVCVDGECAGRCVPGTLQCSDKLLQRCDDNGAWETKETCDFVCENGACTGVCPPSELRCMDRVPQSCDEHGQWTSGALCPNICTNGRCGGSCLPDTEDCLGTVPLKCSLQGLWVNGAIQQNVCDAICTPGAKQCVGVREQTCNATGTRWTDEPIRAPVCDACVRDATRCDGPRRMKQVCTAEGIWQDVGIAQMCGAECDPGATGCSGFVSVGVAGECTSAQLGDQCWFGWTDPNVVFQKTCNANGSWVNSACPLGCVIPAGQQGAGLSAFFCGTLGGVSRCVTSGADCPVP